MDDLLDLERPTDRATGSLAEARRAAALCTRCSLYRNATQTVFGEGPKSARLMLVGEQPGDREDVEGRPFVGPAGKVLDRALTAAGIERHSIYVTNGVKHFKNEPRGKKRLHKRPTVGEIETCRWWLDLERRLVHPAVIVALGGSALRAIIGRPLGVGQARRRGPQELDDGALLVATIHPSFLLRMRDRSAAEAEFGDFVADLAKARDLAA
jgi:DNA polymerase